MSVLPRRVEVPLIIAVGGALLWWTVSAEHGPQLPGRVAAVGLVAVAMVGAMVVAYLDLGTGRWQTRIALVTLAAGALTLLWLQPAGPAVAAVYITAFAAARLGGFGAIVAAVTGVGYTSFLLRQPGRLDVSSVTISVLSFAAAFGFASLMRRYRAERIERAATLERERLAREIHDLLAHTLSALSVQLEAARLLAQQRPGDPAIEAALDRAHRLTTEGLAEARRAVGALRGDPLPGPDLLPRLIADFQRESGIPCRLDVDGTPGPLGPDAQLAIYRATQEALTNVRKHADATAVTVRLAYTRAGAELTVDDTGQPRPSLAAGGFGLTGLGERAALLGGTLEAGPVEGGFRLVLRVPS